MFAVCYLFLKCFSDGQNPNTNALLRLLLWTSYLERSGFDSTFYHIGDDGTFTQLMLCEVRISDGLRRSWIGHFRWVQFG